MKVLLLNGSTRKNGCTALALTEVAKALGADGIETELLEMGSMPIRDCIACGRCTDLGRCVFQDDFVNICIEKAQKANGFVFGSPVTTPTRPDSCWLQWIECSMPEGTPLHISQPPQWLLPAGPEQLPLWT